MGDIRFERDRSLGGGKIRNRTRDAPVGDFLGRLWTLFGRPESIDDSGFTYGIRDRETGLRFYAYSGASGPAFGGSPKGAKQLAPVLRAFEALLDSTPLSDCSIEIPAGTGRVTFGVEHGAPFERITHGKPRSFKRQIAKARRVLDKPQQDPLTWVRALLELSDEHEALAPDPADEDAYRAVMRELWSKAAEKTFAQLTEELRFPEDEISLNELRILLGPTMVSLESAARRADVDWAAFAKRHSAVIEHARRLLRADRS